ncbi:MAG: ABC transporter ATP-binding protein [Thermodesulfobacteriota bacterium]|jgi:branched-chain amino acid transport system ATP-binding protein
MLELKEVHTYYGPSHVLHGINLSLKKGEVVSVMGRNGAGKTTLMRTIMALTPARSGQVHFDGSEITHLRPHQIFARGIKLVPQGRRVFAKLTVEENLRLALVGAKASEPALELKKAYARFSILEERKNQKVRGLSGGERQMLAIARGLLGHTSLLLMDEPSEGLAPLVVRELRDSILKIKGEGVTVLLAEQNTKMALSTGDRHYILEKGEIRFEGTTESISKNGEVMMQYLGVPV